MPSQYCAYLKNRLLSKSIEWHSRLLLLTSAVFTTLVQWIGALQKNTPNPLGRACSRQEVRCKGTANESPGMMAGSTTGSGTENKGQHLRGMVSHPKGWLSQDKRGTDYVKTHCRELTGYPVLVPLVSQACSSQWGQTGRWWLSEHCLPSSRRRPPGQAGAKRTVSKTGIKAPQLCSWKSTQNTAIPTRMPKSKASYYSNPSVKLVIQP